MLADARNARCQVCFIKAGIELPFPALRFAPDHSTIHDARMVCPIEEKGGEPEVKWVGSWAEQVNISLSLPLVRGNLDGCNLINESLVMFQYRRPKRIYSDVKVVQVYRPDLVLKKQAKCKRCPPA